MHKDGAYATGASAVLGPALPPPRKAAPARAAAALRPGRLAPVLDLRGAPPRPAAELRYPAGDVLVVSGLPGSGKSSLIRKTVARPACGGPAVRRIDSQDARDRVARLLPAGLPYALYRPLVRLRHYAGLRRALRSGAGVVVHDCGTLAWVRRWVVRDARRRGRSVHLALLDVEHQVALEGQALRGRGVSSYAFARHRRAVGRLVADAEDGRLPDGFASAVLLDREAASALNGIGFE
ncbi:AAA family ATPase [Streptomyces pathocidini]|uniref:AAA family ATPase n=1 Tax=Streptomyces pathocidini TaxID=1650571 RepID=UPI003F4D1DEF